MDVQMSMEMVLVTTAVFALVAVIVGLMLGLARWRAGRSATGPAVLGTGGVDPGRATVAGWRAPEKTPQVPSPSTTTRDDGSQG